jgi:hypothetical protein
MQVHISPTKEKKMLDAIALIQAAQRTAEQAQSARPVRRHRPYGPRETRS